MNGISKLQSVGGPPITPSASTVSRRPLNSPPAAAGVSTLVARRNTEVLNDLIALAERVLNGPAAPPWIAEVEALGIEVQRAAQRPADARRTIGEAETMLIIALRHLCDLALALAPARTKWRAVTLALLDLTRDDLFAALHQESGVPA